MNNDRTNLLSLRQQQDSRYDYLLRLGVVIVVFIALLVSVTIILLAPTYMFLIDSAKTKEENLANIEHTMSSSEDAELSSRLTQLSSNIATISSLSKTVHVSSLVQGLLNIPRPGITLSGFKYTPPVDKKDGTLSVSGTAVTRESLRDYQLALTKFTFAKSADLPISAYAKDYNIDFNITITLAL